MGSRGRGQGNEWSTASGRRKGRHSTRPRSSGNDRGGNGDDSGQKSQRKEWVPDRPGYPLPKGALGARFAVWGCVCGHPGNWPERSKCRACGKDAPPRYRDAQRDYDRKNPRRSDRSGADQRGQQGSGGSTDSKRVRELEAEVAKYKAKLAGGSAPGREDAAEDSEGGGRTAPRFVETEASQRCKAKVDRIQASIDHFTAQLAADPDGPDKAEIEAELTRQKALLEPARAAWHAHWEPERHELRHSRVAEQARERAAKLQETIDKRAKAIQDAETALTDKKMEQQKDRDALVELQRKAEEAEAEAARQAEQAKQQQQQQQQASLPPPNPATQQAGPISSVGMPTDLTWVDDILGVLRANGLEDDARFVTIKTALDGKAAAYQQASVVLEIPATPTADQQTAADAADDGDAQMGGEAEEEDRTTWTTERKLAEFDRAEGVRRAAKKTEQEKRRAAKMQVGSQPRGK